MIFGKESNGGRDGSSFMSHAPAPQIANGTRGAIFLKAFPETARIILEQSAPPMTMKIIRRGALQRPDGLRHERLVAPNARALRAARAATGCRGAESQSPAFDWLA